MYVINHYSMTKNKEPTDTGESYVRNQDLLIPQG